MLLLLPRGGVGARIHVGGPTGVVVRLVVPAAWGAIAGLRVWFVRLVGTGATMGFAGAAMGFAGTAMGFAGAAMGFAGAAMGFAGAAMGFAGAAMGFAGTAMGFTGAAMGIAGAAMGAFVRSVALGAAVRVEDEFDLVAFWKVAKRTGLLGETTGIVKTLLRGFPVDHDLKIKPP